MNIYDFDNTIYKGDSGVHFVFYSLRKHPLIVISSFFKSIPVCFKYYFFKTVSFKELKEELLRFIIKIDNIDDYINVFVDKKIKNIKPWYKDIQKEDDLVVSGSYELWLVPLCKKIGIKNIMGTKMDMKSGNIIGENCMRDAKIRRIETIYKRHTINKAYSDSKNDIPLLEYAKEAYVVKGDEIIKYEKGYFKN